jgi:uncharacterized membrane protein
VRSLNPAILALGAITVLGAALRFYGLGHQGFWFDEANTALLVHFSPGKMLGLIPQSEATPPLYYSVAWVWARLFGYAEAGLRSLSAVAGVLVVPFSYGIAAKLISQRAGLVAAALTACNPFLIWYSQEARSYELLTLLTACALLAFVYARSAPSPRTLAPWVVASGLALATHYYAVVAIVPQALWLLFEHRRRRSVQIAFALVALCGLALIPLAISQNATGHTSWISHASLRLRLAQILPQFLLGTGAPLGKSLKWIGFGLVLGALVLLAVRARQDERRPVLVAGGLALAGFVLSLVMAAIGFDDLITRNVIALLVPLIVFVAGALSLSRARTLGVVIAAALCAIGITAAIGVAADHNLQRPDWRTVARALGTEPPAGSPGRAILIQHYLTLLPLSLYLPRLHALHRGGVDVNQLDVISFRSPRESFCWWGAACNLTPSEMQSSYPILGFRIVSRRQVEQFTILELASRAPVRLTRAAVSAALVTTRLHRDELLIQRR